MNKIFQLLIYSMRVLRASAEGKLIQHLLNKMAFALTLWVCLAASAFAQEQSILGKITDHNGVGVPGLNVVIRGTTAGVVTDADGNFSIVAPEGTTLVITGVGYKTIEKIRGAESSIHMVIQEDNVALDEVVVTGYSVDKRREVAGSVATVKVQDLTVAPSGNVEQQLQGRVSGVTVITNGQPGTTSQIRVRGFGSFQNNEPLYVVDGVPVNTTDFLNPDDIESVTVLKDAASASIYGARASSGVIVYTTKQGKRNAKKLSVSYNGLFGVTTPGDGLAVMNPEDYSVWTKNAYINSGITEPHPQFGTPDNWKIPEYLLVGDRTGVSGNIDINAERSKYNVTDFSKPIYQVIAANRQGTNWYQEATRNAPISRHSLGISGGGENSRYYVGFGLQDQQGILKNNSFKRYSFRTNTEFSIFSNLRIGENLEFAYRQTVGQSGSNGGRGIPTDENEILYSFLDPTIIPVYDLFGGYAGTHAGGLGYAYNSVAIRDRSVNNKAFDAIGFGNIYLEWEPLKGLVLRSSIGGNYRSTTSRTYTPPTYENSVTTPTYTFSETNNYSLAWTFTNTANYKKVFGGKHRVDILVGQEVLDTGTGRTISASGINPFSTDPDYITLNTVGNRKVSGDQFKGVKFSSLFGQLKYALQDKYIASTVIRRDGSSRFGATNRYGVFPAFSVAWRVSGENFMNSFTWLNDLKLRAGYGTMGNSNAVDPANQYTLYASKISQSYYGISGSGSDVSEGYYRSQIGNIDARWETCTTKNIGLDASLFKDRLEVNIDFWQKVTKDLLVQLPIPGTNGFQAQPPFVNSAQMLNRGVDIQLLTRGKAKGGEIDYEFTVNGSLLRNEISSIRGGLSYLESINPNYRSISPIRNQLECPLSAFYGYRVMGLFKDTNEVNSAPGQDGAGPGRFRFADISGPDGKPDGKIDDLDRTYLGSPVPKFTGGTNLRVKYKNFEVSTYLYTSLGNKIFNMGKWWTNFYAGFTGSSYSQAVKNSWTPNNTNATIPIFENVSNFSTNTQSSSFYVENGNYLRMQNLAFSYHFPPQITNALKVERLKAYFSANNVFTITNYSGIDPGVGGGTDTVFGVDQGNYPVTRSFTAGISVGF